MNKNCIRETMLSLSIEELEHATHNYLQFLEGTKLVPTEPIELDEQAQAKFQANLASSLEQPIHSAEHKVEVARSLDFGPKDKVEPGAVVCVDGRHFVIGVATGKFVCEGVELMGLSNAAPFYDALDGLTAGEIAEFRGREFEVRAVY